MFMDRDKMYQIYHTILSMALSWALTIAINQYFSLGVHVTVCFLFSLIPAVLVYLVDLNRRNPVTYLIMFSLLLAAGLLFWSLHINPIAWVSDLATWVWEYDGSKELYVASHAHVLVLGIGIAGTILFYLLMKYESVKLLLSIIFFGALMVLSLKKVELHKIVIGVAIFYMLSILVEQAGRQYNRKAGRPDKKGGILYLAPVCLLLAVLSVGMPSKPEPIQWKFVKNIYFTIKDKVDHIITEWEFFKGKGMAEFSLAMTGYSDEGGQLGTGELRDNDKVALKVSGFSGENSVYFIGSVSDIYTGNSWKKSKLDSIPEKKDYLLDYYELLLGLSRVDQAVLEDHRFVQRRIVNVEFEKIKTKTFFYPLKSSWYKVYKLTPDPVDNMSNITFKKAVGEGTNYQTIFYEMNLKGEDFQQMLRDADQFSYASGTYDLDRIEEIEYEYFFHSSAAKIHNEPDIFTDLQTRAEHIKEQYTVLPEELPDRVRELAYDITKDAETTYDKLKAIEKHLSTYTYSVTPGNLPEGEDFVDYFLFDNKQGFCTSFATSMAILGRCVGIPTRYVEGFLMDSSDKGSQTYMVRNRKAHSWAEAYIEGVGWIPFEATPPFYEYRYTQWQEIVKKRDTTNPSAMNIPEPIMPPEFAPQTMTLTKEERLPNAMIGGIVVVTTLLTALLLLIIYDIVLRLKYKKKYNKADYSSKMYLRFLRILSMLKKNGFTLGTEDTLLNLSDRIKDLYQYKGILFKDVACVFMKYRYGETQITKAELNMVETFYKGLTDENRAETGRFKLHLEEFLFLAKKSNR